MSALLAIVPWYWRWAALGALAVACMGFGAFKMHEHDQKAYDELAGQFAKFKADVAAAGEAQNKRAAAIAAHDELLKEEADNDREAALDMLRADVERVRRERDSDRSGFLSAATSCTRSAEAAARYRDEYQRAYRDLLSEVRGEGDRGSKAVIDLNSAKAWAHGR